MSNVACFAIVNYRAWTHRQYLCSHVVCGRQGFFHSGQKEHLYTWTENNPNTYMIDDDERMSKAIFAFPCSAMPVKHIT